MRESTKDRLVLLYFLVHDNNLAGADSIVRWTEGREGQNRITVLDAIGQVDSSLSRAGAVKVCRRLVPDYLVSVTTTGYRSKKVILYQLQEKERAFTAIARMFAGSPMIFLQSAYCQKNAATTLIPRLEEALRIELGRESEDVSWALSRSPTALFLALDGTLDQGAIAKVTEENDRVAALLNALSCALVVDEASKTRSQLLRSGNRPARFENTTDALAARGETP